MLVRLFSLFALNRRESYGDILTLMRPIGLPPHAPVAQKIADQRWPIANSAKNKYLFLYKMRWLKVGLCE